MAYGNGFPATYQPMYYQQQYAPQMPQQSNNSLIWVQGEAGAKSYLVAPNSTVQLWDSEAQVIYLKSADASGMPSMKVLDYTIRDLNKNGPSTPLATEGGEIPTFATKADLKAISDEIEAIRKRLNTISKHKEVTADE